MLYGSDRGVCRITGKKSIGIAFDKWVKKTFNDYDYLKPGTIISNEALLCFDEASMVVAEKVGKSYTSISDMLEKEHKKVTAWQKKHKTDNLPNPEDIGIKLRSNIYFSLQRFRTYSHIIHDGEWFCVTKANKREIY